MATEKTKKSAAAGIHAMTYSLPFWFAFRPSLLTLAVIIGTHFVIDRWRLARFAVWAKNLLAPVSQWKPWADRQVTGYSADAPAWLSVWLLIIADNALHVACNALALRYL